MNGYTMRESYETPPVCECGMTGCIGECGTRPQHGLKYHLDPDEVTYCAEVIARWNAEDATGTP